LTSSQMKSVVVMFHVDESVVFSVPKN